MDLGQIFIGKKFQELSREELNKQLVNYGYKVQNENWRLSRINGGEMKYGLYWNDESDFPEGGVIFGIEALAAYDKFTDSIEKENSEVCGYNRDWIQNINLEKLSGLLAEVRKDIPDAEVLLMDIHY